MTDRINALIVILDRDIREDDVQPLANAIKQLRNVLHVELNVADIEQSVANTRARRDLESKLWDVLKG